ncbi:MBG domain-containing protein [Sinomicrobium sp. M5D2P9]
MKIPLPFLKRTFPFAISQINIIIMMMLLFTGFSGSGLYAQSCPDSQVHFYSPVLGVDQTYTINYSPGKEIELETFTPAEGSLGEGWGDLTTHVSYGSSDHTVATISEDNGQFFLVIQGAGTSTIAVHYDDDPADCKTVFTLEVRSPVIQPGAGNILYVNQNVSGGNESGDSWVNAIPELADALKWAREQHDADNNWLQSDSLQIYVAQGTYKPLYSAEDGNYTADGGRDNAFVLVPDVQLFGGFPNNGSPTVNDRDWNTNKTILSGELQLDNNRENNAYHIFLSVGDIGNAVVDGFTVQEGCGYEIPDNEYVQPEIKVNGTFIESRFGAFIMNSSSPTISNCIFTKNSGYWTMALSIYNGGSPLVKNSLFTGNLEQAGKYGYVIGNAGGGSELVLVNVTVTNNERGIRSNGGSIVNSIIWDNGSINTVSNTSINNTIIENDLGGINVDPQFTNPANGDYTLQNTSPAINAGDNAAYTTARGDLANDIDLAGNARVYDYTNSGVIDMGAYEFQGNPRPPVVTDVAVPSDGTYSVGENLDFTVNFDKDITVNTAGGTPELALTIGDTTRYARYISGSGTAALLFRYTVQEGDMDMDGIATGALAANDGTIQHNGTDADLTLNNLPDTGNIFVNTEHPSVTLSTATVSSVNQPFEINIVFSEAVTGLTVEDISATNVATISNLQTTDNMTYTATVTPAADGEVSLSIPAGAAQNIGNNDNVASDTLTLNYDGTSPVVTSVSVPANGTYRNGDELSFTMNYSEQVTVSGGMPSLPVTIGTATVHAGYTGGTGTSVLTFAYTVQDGDLDTNGISLGAAIVQNGAILQDVAGNNASPTLSGIGSTSAVLVDAVVPAGYGVSIDQDPINAANQSAVSFTFSGAEAGADYHYTFSSSEGGTDVSGNGTIVSSTDQIAGIDLNGLNPGTLTLTVYLEDPYGNTGSEVTDTVSKLVPITAQVIAQSNVSCNGGSDGSLTVQVNDGTPDYTYGWSNGSSSLNTSSATNTVSALKAGNYTVTVTDGNGQEATASATVTAPDMATVTTASTSHVTSSGAELGGTVVYSEVNCKRESGIVYATSSNPTISDTKIVMPVTSGSFGTDVSGLQSNTVYYVRAFSTNENDVTVYGDEISFTTLEKKLTVTVTASQDKVYGEVDPTFTYTVTGLENGDDESVLSGELTRVAGEDVGTYTIQQGTLSAGPGYVINFIRADFAITPASLMVTTADKTKVYGETDPTWTVSYTGFVNGDDESDLDGSLSVSRAAGEDVGDYGIIASGHTSPNYTIGYTQGNLEITRAALIITADSQSKVYGEADLELTYTADGLIGDDAFSGALERESGETVGEYTITQGTLTAGSNYDITYEGAVFAITPANLDNIAFNDDEFTYDGAEHTLAIAGELPEGASVTYRNNGRTDAGTQTVTAQINGGANYEDLELTATLTIHRATQEIVFAPIPAKNLENTPEFVLEASASSGLPVTYSHASEGTGSPATVTSDGKVTLHTSGEITITATQEGNHNFLPATPVNRVLEISSGDASIHILRIAESVYEIPGPETRYVVNCGNMAGSVEVEIETEANASVSPARQFTMDLPRPGIYTEEITVASEDGSTTKTYKVTVEKRFDFQDIVIQKFNNVLLVNNNPQTNGGYEFVGYKWYRNGSFIGDGQYYSAGDSSTDLLDSDAAYHVEMTTRDGQTLRSCPMQPQIQHSGKIIVYPNPVLTGNTVNIQADIPEKERKTMQVRVYSHSGREIKRFFTDRENSTMQVSGMPPGVYIIQCTTDRLQKSFKIIVK